MAFVIGMFGTSGTIGTSVQPAGAVIAWFPPMSTDATSTSPSAAPLGRGIVSDVPKFAPCDSATNVIWGAGGGVPGVVTVAWLLKAEGLPAASNACTWYA